MDAIVIKGLTKSFRKSALRREHTTLKTELVRWITRRRRDDPKHLISALRGIDLTIPKGACMGIIGRNGSGKSTLLKLITGIYTPTTGAISVSGRISALLDLGAGFHPDFTGRENIVINGVILGMSRSEVQARMQQIIDFAELGEFIDEPVRSYSSGMYMRLAFAVATHVDPEILIIDEILAVGDEHFSRKSFAKLNEFKRSGKTIVLVTHALDTLTSWCDLGAWIDGGHIRMVGNPEQVVSSYRQAVALAEATGAPMLPSAVSADGGALPATAQESQAAQPGPRSGQGQRWGDFAVEISSVELQDRAGQPVTQLSGDDTLKVRLGYTCKGPQSGVNFQVELRRDDQVNVCHLAYKPEGALAQQGAVELCIERLGLGGGTYLVDVSATGPGDTQHDVQKGCASFSVHATPGEGGLLSPLHRWTVLPSGGLTGDEAPASPKLERVPGSP